MALLIVWKILQTQYADGGYWKKLSDDISLTKIKVIAERGNIYTADGRILATTIPTFELHMDTKADGLKDTIWNRNIDSLSLMLSTFLHDKSQASWKQELVTARHQSERYHLIAKHLSFDQYKTMMTFPLFRLGKNKSGLIKDQNNTRKMPFGMLAQRTIGYIRDSGKYRIGIEGKFNDELQGENKEVLMEKVAGGVYMPVNEQSEFGSKPGLDIYTTLDINLQDVAENSLLKTLQMTNAKHGTVILMQIKTGEIKAIANLGRNKEGQYLEDYNYAIGERNEPGSVMKLASVMALIEDGYCDENYKVDLQGGKTEYFDKTMVDAHTEGENITVTLAEAFAKSSNVGISKPVFKFYGKDKAKFYQKLEQFHLTKPLGMEIMGEQAPLIKDPKEWTGVSLPWISIGYEIQITPLQMLNFYAAVANGGVMMKPYLVKEIKENSETLEQFKPQILSKQIAKPETIEKARRMLENVVESGTAMNIKSQYKIAGKTGTNLIASAEKGYSENHYQASFVGYFPANNPIYACIVVINSPEGLNHYGSDVAAPVFKDIADRIYTTDIDIHPSLDAVPNHENVVAGIFKGFKKDLSYLAKKMGWYTVNSDSTSEWASAVSVRDKVILKPTYFSNKLMPNLREMSVKDAVYLLENMGLIVSVEGRGKIVDQSIKAGQKIYKGSYVKIYLG